MTQKTDNENFKMYRVCRDTAPQTFEALAELEKITVGEEGWSAESFRSAAEKDNGYVLCIFCEDCVAALLTGYYAIGEGDITNVAVAPEHRRKGFAQMLIAEFERLLPDDAENIFLEVRESNIPAIELYKKCGFEKISVRKNFYANPPENAIVMMKAEV